MMGQQRGGQKKLFYSFDLDDHVPPDHLLRGIDQFLDLSELRQHLARYYSHTGRPSIDPQLLIRMLIVGYCFGIPSERGLCAEGHLNLADRWFCPLGLEDPVPDHSTFSKNRHGRFRDSDTTNPSRTRSRTCRVEDRFDLKPDRLIGDTNYGTAEILGWMVDEKQIEPHVSVWDKTQRSDETLSSSDFEWDGQANEYRCPQGQPLRSEWRIFKRPRTRITKANTIIYHASQAACSKCPMKSRCCPNTPNRKIARSVHESARDVAREIAKTDAYKQSRRDRKKVEMLFAHLKRILRLDRLRLRGPNGAHDEFLLAAIAQNLRRMAKWLFSAEPEVTSMAT